VAGFEFVDAGQSFAAACEDAGGDLLDDVADVSSGELEVIERAEGGGDGAAVVVAEDHNQRYVEFHGTVFEGTEDGGVDDVSGGADDEHITEALVEDDLGSKAGVTAAEQHDVGVLAADESFTVLDTLTGMYRFSGHEPFVTFAQNPPGGPRRQSLSHVL